MTLYLLRHPEAEDRAPSGRDADRRLTEEGRAALRRVLERASAAGAEVSLILVSPLKRAMETAEIAAHELGYMGQIVRTQALVPESSPAQVWTVIREHSGEPAILLAGHEPLFSQTVAYFVGSTREMVRFSKGAMMCIEFETLAAEPRGVVRWMLTANLC